METDALVLKSRPLLETDALVLQSRPLLETNALVLELRVLVTRRVSEERQWGCRLAYASGFDSQDPISLQLSLFVLLRSVSWSHPPASAPEASVRTGIEQPAFAHEVVIPLLLATHDLDLGRPCSRKISPLRSACRQGLR